MKRTFNLVLTVLLAGSAAGCVSGADWEESDRVSSAAQNLQRPDAGWCQRARDVRPKLVSASAAGDPQAQRDLEYIDFELSNC